MLALSCFGAGNSGAAGVIINPGDDIQSIVDASPAGTTYKFRAGIYREISVRPKPGDIYEGEPGTILSGARLLTGWVADGAGWYVAAQTQEGRIHGVCQASHPRCNRPENVFVNGRPLLHVDTLSKVSASSYFFDYEADQIYIGQDPTGQVVEASATPIAFAPAADKVTVRGFVIEKYAIPAQMGAVGGQSPRAGWVIEENIIRWNHGTGVRLGDDSVLRNNKILHNGQQGFSGRGRNIRVEGNEVAYNLWNGTNPSWEGGGAKIVRSVAYLARNNWVHHNAGRGLWTDIDNVDTVYEYNTVTDNSQDGLAHEISYSARISDNIAARNGDSFDVWLWGSNILIQNSSNVEVAGNYVEVAASGGNGIGIIEQSRGSGMLGPWVSRDVRVQGNVVVHKGRAGRNGAVEDHGNEQFFSETWGLRFDGNTYHTPAAGRALFAWDKSALSLPGFRSAGQEATSVIDTAVSSSPPVPRARLHAEPPVIMAGQSSALTFESLLVTRCTADWKNSDWVSGQITVSPMETTDYSLTCHGEGGSVEATATVTVR
jgi:hypothetical protein